MRIQSSHPQDVRALDVYFTPVEAVVALSLSSHRSRSACWNQRRVTALSCARCARPGSVSLPRISATAEAPYAALLLRTNFLVSTAYLPFFRRSPPSKVWISSRVYR
jgi:hypothetical protein